MSALIVDEAMLREPNLWIPFRSPNGPCLINKESPLFKKLKPSWVFGPQRKAYYPDKGPLWTPLEGGTLDGGPFGKGFRANGGVNDGFISDINADFLSGATTLSFFILSYSRTTTGILAARWGAALTFGGFICYWNLNQITTIVARNNIATNYCSRSTATATTGLNAVGFTWNGTNSMDVYRFGKLDNGAIPFDGNCSTIQSTSSPLYLCRHADGNTGSGAEQILFAAFSANQVWTANDHAAIAADPFSMIIPA